MSMKYTVTHLVGAKKVIVQDGNGVVVYSCILKGKLAADRALEVSLLKLEWASKT